MDNKLDNLFREEAVVHKRQRLHGSVLLLPRLSHTVIISLLLLWTFMLVAWLASSSYARTETLNGWLAPAAGVLKVYVQKAGTINTLLVGEGDKVVAGQPLIAITTNNASTNKDNEELRLLEEYKSYKAQLEQQLQRDPHSSIAEQSIVFNKKITELRQKIANIDNKQFSIIKASRDGVVDNLQAAEGQLLKPNDGIPLLTLSPENGSLYAHLLIPVRSAGFIEPEQLLTIRYTAFPYQKFGFYEGRIQTISTTALLPHELRNVPFAVNEPVYRVTAQIQSPIVVAYGKEVPLKSGMTFSADVHLGERSLVQWLFEPLYSLRGKI